MNQNKIKELLEEREELCIKMIEASRSQLVKLERQLQVLEQEIETITGKSVNENAYNTFIKGESND